jgi:hypothetical protein
MVPNGTHPHKVEASWDQVFSGDLPENPARQLFTNTVITVAAQAKAALPEANGRVDRARDLVLGGLVSRNADSTFTVRSQQGKDKSYTVNGSCACPDAEKGQPQCKHLIATWIWRKARKAVEEQLASEGNGQHAPAQPAEAPKVEQSKADVPATALPEAPASCNVYVTLAGRKVQVTLRDSDEVRMLARLEQLLQRFPAEEEAEQESPEGWCAKHGVQMKLNHNAKGTWWSHKTTEGWCHGK